ncbi:extracellular solute-binding protein [Clostridium sediminicola]|uniref:extracellular solute-binding protein n=1 Tax=Clostridium sediminicola TaxID=3114879 RepID=UPI0031F255CE
MKKRLIGIITAVALMFSLVACGGTQETTSTNDGKSTNDAAETKEPVTIRLVMKDEGPSNPTAVAYFKQLEKDLKENENLDIKIELIDMPEGNYAEKLNLMLLSKNIPDIIYFQGGDKQIADQGLLEDLTPYIEKSKNIKNIMQPYNTERMKNYPYLLWIKPLSQKIPVIRKDWFDKMETADALMKDPSIDNYYNFLKELKTNTPGGEGKPSYGITVAGKLLEIDSIFDMAFGNTTTWLKGEDGKYVYSLVSDSEKEKLTFYNKLYKEGILDPEYTTKKWDTKEKAFYDSEVGVISGTSGKVVDIYDGKMKKANDTSLVVLPPAKGKSQGFGATDVTKETRGIAISALSENKEIAFKILDYLASTEGQMLDRLGFENEHYKVVDGKIELTEKAQEWYARFWEPNEFKPSIPLKSGLLGEPGQKSLESTGEYYKKDINFMIPEEFTAKWDAMENLYKEYSADIITGKKPINDFDKFVQEWYKAGGEEITEYANENLK